MILVLLIVSIKYGAGGFYCLMIGTVEKNTLQMVDCVIFKDAKDLNEKIKYYLENPELVNMISKYGHESVKSFSRTSWASKIVELSYGI